MDEQILAAFVDEIDKLQKVAEATADEPKKDVPAGSGFAEHALTKKASAFIELLKTRF